MLLGSCGSILILKLYYWHLKAENPKTQLIFFLFILYIEKYKNGRRRTVLLEGEHVVAVPSETASVDRSSHPCLAYSFA